MARELRREHDRARRALQEACRSLLHAASAAGGGLPGDFPAMALASEALVEVARWLRGRISLVPAPSEADFGSPYPFRDPWEARVVLNPAERLDGLVSLQDLRLALHRVAARPQEALRLALGADARTAQHVDRALHCLVDALDQPAGASARATGQVDTDDGRLRRATERLQDTMRRAASLLQATHPHAASHLRLMRRMVALPLAVAVRRMESQAARALVPEVSAGAGRATVCGDLGRLLGHLRLLADSLDPLRLLDGGGHLGPTWFARPQLRSPVAPGGMVSDSVDRAREGRWGMMPLLFLRLFDCTDARGARSVGKAAGVLFRALRHSEAAGRLHPRASHPPSGALCSPEPFLPDPPDAGAQGDGSLFACGEPS